MDGEEGGEGKGDEDKSGDEGAIRTGGGSWGAIGTWFGVGDGGFDGGGGGGGGYEGGESGIGSGWGIGAKICR